MTGSRDDRNRHWRVRPGFAGMAALLLLSGCERAPPSPTIEQIRQAHAAKSPALIESDLPAFPVNEPKIPDQEPVCTAEGEMHFDCSIELIVSSEGQEELRRKIAHVWYEDGEWRIENLP